MCCPFILVHTIKVYFEQNSKLDNSLARLLIKGFVPFRTHMLRKESKHIVELIQDYQSKGVYL
jgi:hypothetical protein